MPITVERGLAARLRAQRVVAVLITGLPDDRRTAATLRAAVEEIAVLGIWQAGPEPDEVEGGVRISDEPIRVPNGHLLIMDTGATPPRAAATIPEVLADHLRRARVEDARIGVMPQIGQRYSVIFDTFAPTATALLAGPPEPPGGAELPLLDQWLVDTALGWLHAHRPDGLPPLMLIGSAEAQLDWDGVRTAVDDALRAALTVVVLATDFETVGASAVLGDLLGTGIALHASGRRSATDLREVMIRQRALIRDLAGRDRPRWAGVTAQADARWTVMGNAADDEESFEPMWYQLLSTDRVRRLGGPPPGAVELADGRVELTVGEPEQWIPGHPGRDTVLASARHALAGRV